MKTIEISNYARLLAVATITFFGVTSCEKDDKDNKPADYIGSWVTVKTVPSEEGDFEIQDVVNFTANSFNEIASMRDPESDQWIAVIGRKAKITEKSGEMNVSITEAGYSTVDDETGYPTGNIVYYKDGTDEFSSLLEDLEMSRNYKALYSVSEDELTLKADNNNNGSFDDEDEVNTFTRKK
jgi:hypothetical protein